MGAVANDSALASSEGVAGALVGKLWASCGSFSSMTGLTTSATLASGLIASLSGVMTAWTAWPSFVGRLDAFLGWAGATGCSVLLDGSVFVVTVALVLIILSACACSSSVR
jgi:hypothetical protein